MGIGSKENRYNMIACHEAISTMENKAGRSVRSMGMEHEGGPDRDDFTGKAKLI